MLSVIHGRGPKGLTPVKVSTCVNLRGRLAGGETIRVHFMLIDCMSCPEHVRVEPAPNAATHALVFPHFRIRSPRVVPVR